MEFRELTHEILHRLIDRIEIKGSWKSEKLL
ncbi:DUF4368 domain-containing protein [Neobacillus sp. WH10]